MLVLRVGEQHLKIDCQHCIEIKVLRSDIQPFSHTRGSSVSPVIDDILTTHPFSLSSMSRTHLLVSMFILGILTLLPPPSFLFSVCVDVKESGKSVG